jgi:probable HAF family extracellular repeat protein
MRLRLRTYISAAALLAAATIPLAASAHVRDLAGASKSPYKLVILGTLGGTETFAIGVNDRSWVVGESALPGNSTLHATLWTLNPRRTVDLGTLGGPNSFAGVHDDRGLIAGYSDTSASDPLNENFCTFGSGDLCQGFVWQGKGLIALPALPGGNNSEAVDVNDAGQVAGISENGAQDTACLAPQVFDYEAVVWGSKKDQIATLPALTGDTVSEAYAINDNGDVVGASGQCIPPGTSSGLLHAVLWRHGKPVALPTLGGTLDNSGHTINELGGVSGSASLTGNTTLHAVLWNTPKKIVDLGTLPGDWISGAWGLNDAGQAIGYSCSYSFAVCRGFLSQNGVMTDINTLISPNSRYSLAFANGISDSGSIAGYGFDAQTGDLVGFVLVPTGQPARLGGSSVQPTMPPRLRERVLRHESLRPF